jgi:hypothetical protein
MDQIEFYLDDQLINSFYDNNYESDEIIETQDYEPHNAEPPSIEPQDYEPHNAEPPEKIESSDYDNTIEELNRKINKIKRNRHVARGRGRCKQLKTMSKEEIKKERKQSLEANRLAAKRCRLKKKMFIYDLETKIYDQNKLIKNLQKELKKLKGK